MLIPVPVGNLDEADAGFGESPGEKALATESVGRIFADSVESFGLLRFAGNVHDGGNGVLHAEGELIGFDHAFDFGVVGIAIEFFEVKGFDEIELGALEFFGKAIVGKINEFWRLFNRFKFYIGWRRVGLTSVDVVSIRAFAEQRYSKIFLND